MEIRIRGERGRFHGARRVRVTVRGEVAERHVSGVLSWLLDDRETLAKVPWADMQALGAHEQARYIGYRRKYNLQMTDDELIEVMRDREATVLLEAAASALLESPFQAKRVLEELDNERLVELFKKDDAVFTSVISTHGPRRVLPLLPALAGEPWLNVVERRLRDGT